MKLLFCKKCNDVVALRRAPRSCQCEASWGSYRKDLLHASYSGPCIPLGFNNADFTNALREFPFEGARGVLFEAFVIPVNAPTYHVEEILNDGTPTT